MKRFLLLIIALITAAGVAACSNEANEPTVSMYDLRVAMLAADSEMPEMKNVSSVENNADKLFTYLSDFDYNKIDAYYLAYAADGMAFEVAVVALKKASDVPEMVASLKKHVENRVSLYKSYAPDQVPLAEATLVTSSGRYAALIMCRDQAAVRAVFEQAVKG